MLPYAPFTHWTKKWIIKTPPSPRPEFPKSEMCFGFTRLHHSLLMEKGFAFSFKFVDYTLSSYLEERNLRFFLSNKFLVVGGERYSVSN